MVYVLSWNVAGWSTTAGCIVRKYGTFDRFFQKHGSPDIICLQEVKIDTEKIAKLDATKVGPTDCVHGESCTDKVCPSRWTSFWSISTKRKGYSGVTTFARRESVIRATSKVFLDPKFDDEGRCVATLHDFSGTFGSSAQRFLLINVYVPYGGSSEERLQYKHDFLRHLAAAIERLQKEWAVSECILAGDINVSFRDTDIHWLYRTFPADFDNSNNQSSHNHYPEEFINALRDIFKKEQGMIDFEGALPLMRKRNFPAELVQLFAHNHGILPIWKALCSTVFHSLFCEAESLQLTDSFAHCHKHASNRFTCWDQSRNRRFKNIGTRIDYILVTDALKKSVWPAHENNDSRSEVTSYSSEVSQFDPLKDATANGSWKATNDPLYTYSNDENADEYQFMRTSVAHTGIIYTPPQYSDHVPVTLKLDWSTSDAEQPNIRMEKRIRNDTSQPQWNAETNSCNFSALTRTGLQREITSFFPQKKKFCVTEIT
ncbi:ap endonuclease [Perkinsela sp. CCAP 1560/4]|nr:ap endonuclease [Perkinsela sp. CCAP 1560/4]|eukprot:KNH06995.1 ap endonuclease [Perkinsela sp. CCAP 1560/4]